MSSPVAFLVGQMIGAGILAIFLAFIKQWRWVLAPFVLLAAIWGVGYWLATS